MARLDIDWSVWRRTVAVLAAVVMAGGAAAAGTWQYRQSMMEYRDAQQARLAALTGQYQTMLQEIEQVNGYLGGFETLRSQGLVSEEQRLSWVERLRVGSMRLKLPVVDFAVLSRETYAVDLPAVVDGTVQLYRSPMHLRLGLAHEADLLSVFSELERAQGLFDVKNCALDRSGSELQFDPAQPNVTAECDLNWYTLAPAGQVEGGES